MFLLSGRHVAVEEQRDRFWEAMAMTCRYGHCGINEAMAMPKTDADRFLKALAKLIEQENRPGED